MEPPSGRYLTEEHLANLPTPVARSLRRSGLMGEPVPRSVSLTQTGRLRSSENKPWMKFTATETYDVFEPAFEWSAALRVGGVKVGSAVDTLAEGHGRIHVRLLGMIDLVDASGPELDQGALMRWLNETMWFPQVWATGLLQWQPIDETSAIASLESHGMVVSAEFRFDSDGRFIDFVADRYRDVDGDFKLTGWSTPITAHSIFNGIELPSRGSGVWALPEGDLEYIQLRVESVHHETGLQPEPP